MKFLCLDCDSRMEFEARDVPGDGTFGASFRCPDCGRAIAMLANPMESQLVDSLGVQIGGSEIGSEQPLNMVREIADQAQPVVAQTGQPVQWSEASRHRLDNVPSFVRGMVKRIYADWASERGIDVITPEIMDRARTDLGLEDM